MQRLYRGMGLIAGSAAVPFVASVAFLTSPSPDTTLSLVSLSLPSRALGFAREGERYTASYTARLELRQGQTIIRQLEATETVRVPTFRETARTDESVIWQQFLRIPPGRYSLTVSIKDGSSIRGATEDVILDVPRLVPGALATPVPVYEAIPRTTGDSLPRLLARPRASVVFGQDSILPLYLDNPAATAPERLRLRALGDGEVLTWDTTLTLDRRGNGRSATIAIPVSRLAIGVNTLQLLVPGTSDEARTRVFVSLGDDLPIAGFDEMLGYLRFFTTAERLERASVDGADYASVGPVHETPLRPSPSVGYRAVHRSSLDAKLPWFAVGGIDATNVDRTLASGADRIVVARAIADADDPRAATEALATAIEDRAGRTKSEEANAAARAQLKPFAPGERPAPAAIAAILLAGVALTNLLMLLIGYQPRYALQTDEAKIAQGVFGVAGLALAVAVWFLKPFALLILQALLILTTVLGFFGLLTSGTLAEALLTGGVTLVCAWLFYRLIRVLARAQTPTHPRQPPHNP